MVRQIKLLANIAIFWSYSTCGPYHYRFVVSQLDHGRERPIHLARGNGDDPGSGICNSLRCWAIVPGGVHDRDPLLDGVESTERVLLRSEGERKDVHSVVDGVVDGREHAS